MDKQAIEAVGTAAAQWPESLPKDHFELLRKINDVYYDQIRIADQKAAYIFTFTLAFMISSAEGRSVFTWKRYLDGNVVESLIAGLLAMTVVVALVSAILVVMPRVRTTTTSLFWGAWETHRGPFLDSLRTGDNAYILQEYVGNVDNLAAIARAKYRFVGYAFRSLAVAVLSYVALLLAG